MKLDDLKPTPGSKRKRTRVGRGIAAGKGKTAGRGTKGQGARGRRKKKAYFEGGQLPLVRRLPFKRGFTNLFRTEYQEVNLEALNDRFEDGATVNPQTLAEVGLIRKEDEAVVILGRGELDKNLNIAAHRASKSALEKIEKAGGSFEKLELKLEGVFATIKKKRKEDLAEIYGES